MKHLINNFTLALFATKTVQSVYLTHTIMLSYFSFSILNSYDSNLDCEPKFARRITACDGFPFWVSKWIAAAFYHIIKLARNWGDPISNAVSKAHFNSLYAKCSRKTDVYEAKFIFFFSWFIFERLKWKLFSFNLTGIMRKRRRWTYQKLAPCRKYEKYDTKAKDKHISIFQWNRFYFYRESQAQCGSDGRPMHPMKVQCEYSR